MAWALLALGLVFFVEGLVYALAPGLVEELLRALRALPPESRRAIGFGAMALGAALIWLAGALGVFG